MSDDTAIEERLRRTLEQVAVRTRVTARSEFRVDLDEPTDQTRQSPSRRAWFAPAVAITAVVVAALLVGGIAIATRGRHHQAVSVQPSVSSPSQSAPSTAPSTTNGGYDRCTPGQLSATVGFVANASSALGGIVFANRGASPCTLTGRPSVRVIDSHGTDLALRQTSGAGNTPGPPPTRPIVLSAHGVQPQAGVPIDWYNWCASPTGAVSVNVQFSGWKTALVASPSANAEPPLTPPCVDTSLGSSLGVDVVRSHDATGYRS